jgi:hypothetical protein
MRYAWPRLDSVQSAFFQTGRPCFQRVYVLLNDIAGGIERFQEASMPAPFHTRAGRFDAYNKNATS